MTKLMMSVACIAVVGCTQQQEYQCLTSYSMDKFGDVVVNDCTTDFVRPRPRWSDGDNDQYTQPDLVDDVDDGTYDTPTDNPDPDVDVPDNDGDQGGDNGGGDGPHTDDSDPSRNGNNGWGNGDQSAPGNAGGRNNAENSDRGQRNHGQGNPN